MGNQQARAQAAASLVVFVNGERRVVDVDPATPLASWLRTSLSMTGTKVGCGTGGCGACTVMVSRLDREEEEEGVVRHFTVNACLVPVCAVDHCHVTTVEGSDSILERVRESFSSSHATQCGFCTPGFVMSVYCQLRNNPDVPAQELIAALDGNLCRCTGYRPILDAVKKLCPCGQEEGGCCQKQQEDGDTHQKEEGEESAAPSKSGEFIFPPHLRTHRPADLVVAGVHTTFVRPTTLTALQAALERYGPRVKLLGGASSAALRRCPDNVVLLSGALVPEMREISLSYSGGLALGGSVTLAETQAFLREHHEFFHPHHPLGALAQLLPWIASTQVRDMATWGGACALCEPNSDLIAFLAAVGAEAHILAPGGKTHTTLVAQLVAGPFLSTLKPDEVIVSLFVPPPVPLSYCASYKYSPRGQLARATLGGTVLLRLSAAGVVQSLQLAAVGVDATRVAVFALDALKGLQWELAACDSLMEASRARLHPAVAGEQEQYRKYLVDALLYEFLVASCSLFVGHDAPPPPPSERLASRGAPVTCSQELGSAPEPALAPVGVSVAHHSGQAQTHGLAKFADDEGVSANLLYCVPVLSKSAHATFSIAEDDQVRAMPGVVDVVYARDIPGVNCAGAEQGPFLAQDETCYWGEPLALVVATSQLAALRASTAVRVAYTELPAVVTLEEAIAAGSEHAWAADDWMPQHLWHGDVAGARCARVLEGSVSLAASEHLYLEPHSCTVVPGENGSEFSVTATTQNLAALSEHVATATGVARNRVAAQCRRLGGGFGGKGIPALALPAVAAAKLRRPVRMTLTRHHDMVMSTKRGETRAEWRVGLGESGRIESLEMTIWYAAGWHRNAMHMIPNLMALSGMGSYWIPNFSCRLKCMRLNRAMTGPFRGAGIPQGCFILETVMERTAHALGVDPDEFRQRHKRPTSGGMHLQAPVHGPVTQAETMAKVMAMARFEERKAAVAQHNAGSRWIKRGLALQLYAHPVGAKNSVILHQGRGVVHVAADGSVTIGNAVPKRCVCLNLVFFFSPAHQGIEMGQGVHIKMCQVVAHELGVPLEHVRVAPTGTDLLGHTLFETGGSVGAEVNAAALAKACAKVRKNKAKICAMHRLDDAKTSLARAAALATVSRIALSGWACVAT